MLTVSTRTHAESGVEVAVKAADEAQREELMKTTLVTAQQELETPRPQIAEAQTQAIRSQDQVATMQQRPDQLQFQLLRDYIAVMLARRDARLHVADRVSWRERPEKGVYP
jgi:hypothetical protein